MRKVDSTAALGSPRLTTRISTQPTMLTRNDHNQSNKSLNNFVTGSFANNNRASSKALFESTQQPSCQ